MDFQLHPIGGTETSRVTVSFRADEETAKEFDRLCAAAGITMSEGLRQLMDAYVKGHGKGGKGH